MNSKIIALAIAAIAVIGIIAWAMNGQNELGNNGQNNPGDSQDNTATSVQIALLDYRDTGSESQGPERGCDRVVFVERQVTETTAPLTTALEELFSLESEEVNGWHNFLARTNDTLSFERATVENGTAHIYLNGQLTGLAGVCDNPRAKIQIEETALQFPTVDRVQLYLNGQQTELQPNEQGTGQQQNNTATCNSGDQNIERVVEGNFRSVAQQTSAGTATVSGQVVEREFELFGSRHRGLYLRVPRDSASAFYTYFRDMVQRGNTVNAASGETLLFKLGTVQNGEISSTANISELARQRLNAALPSEERIALNLQVPVYVGSGAPANFSFACAITVAQ